MRQKCVGILHICKLQLTLAYWSFNLWS